MYHLFQLAMIRAIVDDSSDNGSVILISDDSDNESVVFAPEDQDYEMGYMLNSPPMPFVNFEPNGSVVRTAEKQKISNLVGELFLEGKAKTIFYYLQFEHVKNV